MARRWALSLACISLCLQLPGAPSPAWAGAGSQPDPGSPPRGPLPAACSPGSPRPGPRSGSFSGPSDRSGGRTGPRDRPPAPGRPRPRRHPAGSRPRHAQLLRVGCGLGTCQVQHLGHRLWQLAGPAGSRDFAPVDPSSPHSYG